ncbi:MAG: extracellular solute-binding protein [Candidatus Dormibacteria bacterium]
MRAVQRYGRWRWGRSGRGVMSAAVVAALGVVLTACGSATGARPTGSGVVSVTLWESHLAGPVGDAVSALVKQFNGTHHNVHLALDVTSASTKALGAFEAGHPPLLAEISHYDNSFVSAHALLSLNSFMFGSSGLTHQQWAQFDPVFLSNGEVGGQHYRLMAGMKVSQLNYNEPMLAAAGITSRPVTWGALCTDLKILKAKDPGVIPLAWKNSSAHEIPPFLSNGGSIFKPGTNNTQTDWNSPAGVATLDFFRTLYSQGLMIFSHGNTIRADLAAGKLAIGDGTSAGYAKALDAVAGKFPMGVWPYPAGSSGHTANLAQGLGFVIMTGHTKAQDAAAWEVIKFLLSPQSMAYWSMHTGFAAVSAPARALIPASFLASHPGIAVSNKIAASPYTIPRPIPAAYAEVQSALDTAFFNAVTGKQSVASALAALDATDQKYLTGKSGL